MQFVQDIGYVLTVCNIDIILGDFNINYLHNGSIRPLESVLSSFGYSQIVQSPTFISAGSMLNQVYLKTSNLELVQNSVLSVYYSDHDAVQVSVKIKKVTVVGSCSCPCSYYVSVFIKCYTHRYIIYAVLLIL